MRKILRNLSIIITILIILTGIDIYSLFTKGETIFPVKEEMMGDSKVIKSLLYDAYFCEEFTLPQVKIKGTKYLPK